jgi:hypothetical protein
MLARTKRATFGKIDQRRVLSAAEQDVRARLGDA